MQVLFLSNRAEILAETLDYVRAFMPWADDVIVIAPKGFDLADPKVRLIDETECLTAHEKASVADLGHGPRNAVLRRSVIERGDLDDVLVMSDDDYRPLFPVDQNDIVDDGRLHGYVSHDLAAWRQINTSYDHTQRYVHAACLLWGAPHLGYGSHMPQAIHRGIFAEAHSAWDALASGIDRYGADRFGIDEWSLFNNWGRKHHADMFWSPRSYRTLAWPQFPHEWPQQIQPFRIQFENFYPGMYEPGQLFDGIPTKFSASEAASLSFVKLERWLELDAQMDRLSPRAATPWTRSGIRRATFSALRPVNKLREYASFGERARSAALSAEHRRLSLRLDADIPAELHAFDTPPK